jgi:hypothetical protein
MPKGVLVVDDRPAVAPALKVAFRVDRRFVVAIVSAAAAGQVASHGGGMRAQAVACAACRTGRSIAAWGCIATRSAARSTAASRRKYERAPTGSKLDPFKDGSTDS